MNRLSGVFYVWLDATLNFQRLDFKGLPLDIKVTYKTPVPKSTPSGMGAPQCQMHRLRDAAHETHMGFLTDWFPDELIGSKDGSDIFSNGAVTYCYNRKGASGRTNSRPSPVIQQGTHDSGPEEVQKASGNLETLH